MTKATYENVPEGVDDITWKSIFITDEELVRVRKLMLQTKEIQCFECCGTIFKGNPLRAAMDFVHSTRYPADFYVWLQDTHTILK